MAHQHGWAVAKAEECAAQLVAMGAKRPEGVKALAARHLLAMVGQVEGQPSPKPQVVAKEEPPPPPPPPPRAQTIPPPPPAPPEEAPEVKVEPQGDDLADMLNAFGDDEPSDDVK